MSDLVASEDAGLFMGVLNSASVVAQTASVYIAAGLIAAFDQNLAYGIVITKYINIWICLCLKDAVISTLGTASVNNSLRLTTGGSESGVAYYPLPVYTHTGFYSNLTWTPTNCDAENNGADGFTLFFSKSQPQESDVYLSSGGLLGVGSVPNVTMFAYSATFHEFYVCNWTSPLGEGFRYVCNFVRPAPGPKMTCPNSYVFEHNYDGRTLQVRVNGASIFSTPLKLEPVPYFVGLSGATGGGYFTQDVSNWMFNSTTTTV